MTHKHNLIFSTMIVLFVASSLVKADLELNQVPPLIQLAGDVGGRLDGTSWNSSELQGVVHILMYGDPDKIRVNEHVEEALAKEQYPSEKIRSIAITNLALDHSYNVLVFGPNGNLLFNQGRALSGVEVANLTALIWLQISN